MAGIDLQFFILNGPLRLLKKLSCLRNEPGNAPSFSVKKFVQFWCFSSLNILENSGVDSFDWSILCGKVCFFLIMDTVYLIGAYCVFLLGPFFMLLLKLYSFILSFICSPRHVLCVFIWWVTETGVELGLPLHLDLHTESILGEEWMSESIRVKSSHFQSAWEPLKWLGARVFLGFWSQSKMLRRGGS